MSRRSIVSGRGSPGLGHNLRCACVFVLSRKACARGKVRTLPFCVLFFSLLEVRVSVLLAPVFSMMSRAFPLFGYFVEGWYNHKKLVMGMWAWRFWYVCERSPPIFLEKKKAQV